MIVTFSVITWGELGDRVRGILALLEKAVQTEVAGAAYGDAVDNFHASLIAISTDLNKKELKRENRTGVTKNLFTGEKIRHVSVAVSFDPDALSAMTDAQIRNEFCREIIKKLQNIGFKVPKGFDYEKLSKVLTEILERLRFPN